MKVLKKLYNRIYINKDTYSPDACRKWQTLNVRGAYRKTANIHEINKEAMETVNADSIIFHSYWYGEIGRKQALSIKSLIFTQKNTKVKIWLWLDSESGYKEYKNNKYLKPLLQYIVVKEYCPNEAIEGTKYKNVGFLFNEKDYLPYRADAFRMWVLNKYGGLYFDLDILFLQDFTPLLTGPEFCYPWEYQNYANNAILYFRKDSYINSYLEKKVCRLKCTRPWVLFNFDDKNLKTLMVYPCSFFDPLWNQDDKMYPIHEFKEFFSKDVSCHKGKTFHVLREAFFPYSFAYHWHNHWNEEIVHNSFFELFEQIFDEEIEEKK